MNLSLGPDPWRQLTNSEHNKLRAELQSHNTLLQGINHRLVSGPQTPLDKSLESFLTVNPYMIGMKTRADILSIKQDPVLITGDTGTGKELMARILHGNRSAPFVAINVAAITDTLIESELFGHLKGSFTGANSDRAGLIETAGNGTLFIDEIGDMSLGNQTKLLRVLQENSYRPVGSSVDKPAACRFVFATHRDIGDMARGKKFRLDLYYRINTFRISLSNLSNRAEDIPLLAKFYGIPGDKLDEFVTLLTNLEPDDRDWPGNCRQLQGYVKRFLTFGRID